MIADICAPSVCRITYCALQAGPLRGVRGVVSAKREAQTQIFRHAPDLTTALEATCIVSGDRDEQQKLWNECVLCVHVYEHN